MEIEDEGEANIPTELRITTFPVSFQYYDPILVILQKKMPKLKKQVVFLKEKLAYDIYKSSDPKMMMKGMLGL